MFSVAVLGAVSVRRDGELLAVPTGKTTELLVRLALEAGWRVRADTLIEDLWTQPVGRNTLQSKVSQLRRALGDRDVVIGTPDGYTLAVDRGSVDALRVLDLAAQATAARAAGDLPVALEAARSALALFHGEPLVHSGDWAAVHRTRLTEVGMGLLEDVMAARVDLGSGGDVVGELEALVEQYPLREGLWTSLITALYRAGRQVDALSAYTRVRTLLVDLGIEPGDALQTLERQVLRQAPSLAAVPQRQPVATPGNLPVLTSSLVGREAEGAALASLSQQHRLVTVVGPAGVGKTRLAIEVARGLAPAGGVWMVRLDSADESSSIAEIVQSVLHVVGGESALVDRLNGAETVLLLDNCEQVVELVGALAGRLLDAAPRVRFMTTSQVPLGLDGELVYRLEPLSNEDSVSLFAERAQSMRQQFTLDEATSTVVEEVCRSLDGLPLAIELAAARIRSLSVRDIAQRLEDRFALLQDPSSHRPQRSRALVSAIAWSYDLLFPDDQRGLWALSCFAGNASLEATEQVLASLGVPRPTVLDTITRLVDRSLVSADPADNGTVRYRLLDSIQAYANARLHESGQADTAASAHASWYAATAAWCEANVRTRHQSQCLAVARAERANIDAALAWSAAHDADQGVRIANGFGWTWVVLGEGTAGAARVRNAMTPGTPAPDRAKGLLIAGWLEASAGDVTLAVDDLTTAATIADQLDDDILGADAQQHQAFLAIQQGRPKDVLALTTASLATYRLHALQWETAASLILAAYGSIMIGDTQAASNNALEALEILNEIGDSWGLVHAQAMLGGIAQAEHRFDDAAHALSKAAHESERLGFVGQAALHLATLARVQQRAGHVEESASSFHQAINAAAASGDGRLAATARLNLARLHRSRGDHEAALTLLEEDRRWYERAGGGEGALLNRCMLYAETSNASALEEALTEARAAENDEVQVYALDALARLAAEGQDKQGAEQLIREADSVALRVSHLVDDLDRIDRNAAETLLTSTAQ